MLRIFGVLLLVPGLAMAAPTLDRDPGHYTVLGLRRVRLKNFAMEPPGCHVGVNCTQPDPNSPCGQLNAKHARFEGAGQLVGDNLCASESFFEVFKNRPSTCGPDCSMISSPGPASDCTTPFSGPILDDLDHDGVASCSSDDCTTDPGDIAAACGATLPFPACTPTHSIEVLPGADCPTDDVLPGNGQCDLAAGSYGTIRVRNGARITFANGTTIACAVKAGRATRLTSAGTAVVLLPGAGVVKVNNTSDAGSTCGALRFVSERGVISFGRNGDFAVDACTIGGKLKLGHANNLRGRFVGSDVVMDFNNDGRCCAPAPPPTTTTTSTVPATTSTTVGGTTTTSTTLGGGGSTSSSTTLGGGSTTTSTTTGGASTTSTTEPPSGFTRTVGFYKTHPSITASILAASGPLVVCGHPIVNVQVSDARSALEAMCVAPHGDQRLQLIRQLTAASLSVAAGGATIDLGPCDAVCEDAGATTAALAACIDAIDDYNQSGDAVAAPWGMPASAEPGPCDVAANTPCTLVETTSCSAP